jgi:hypothetical protein
MGVTTWLDRITDESNLWLTAARSEEAGDYASATVQYLRDAVACLNRGSKVRAALSCFCAAECLGSMGDGAGARSLYSQAGKLYSAIAEHGVSGSIREALWALQRAYACYVLADLVKEGETIKEAYILLARRANPFSGGSEWLEMPEVVPRTIVATSSNRTSFPIEVKEAVEEFLELAGTRGRGDAREVRPKRVGGVSDDQESFVSQLG